MSDQPTGFEVESGVSLFDGKPFVGITIGKDNLHRFQVRPEKAREMALMLLECAEAADQDAAIHDFMRTKMDGTVEDGARMVAAIREHRQKVSEGGDE